MSTLTFLRKFMARWMLAMAVLATPSLLMAADGSTSGSGGGSQANVSHHGDGGGTHVNIQLSDQAISELSSLLSQVQFNGSCSNGVTQPPA